MDQVEATVTDTLVEHGDRCQYNLLVNIKTQTIKNSYKNAANYESSILAFWGVGYSSSLNGLKVFLP